MPASTSKSPTVLDGRIFWPRPLYLYLQRADPTRSSSRAFPSSQHHNLHVHAHALPCCRTVPKSGRESDPHQPEPPPIFQWQIHCMSVGSRDIHVQLLRRLFVLLLSTQRRRVQPPAPSKAPVLPFRHSLNLLVNPPQALPTSGPRRISPSQLQYGGLPVQLLRGTAGTSSCNFQGLRPRNIST
jgi:hypothetical protein